MQSLCFKREEEDEKENRGNRKFVKYNFLLNNYF